MLDLKNYEPKQETYSQLGLKQTQNIEYRMQHTFHQRFRLNVVNKYAAK